MFTIHFGVLGTYFWFNTPYISVRKFHPDVGWCSGLVWYSKITNFVLPKFARHLPEAGLPKDVNVPEVEVMKPKECMNRKDRAAFWKWKDAYMKERSCRSWNMWFFGNGKSEWYVFFFPGTIWQSHITFLQNTIEDEVAFFHGWDRLLPQNLSLITDVFFLGEDLIFSF